MGVSVYRVEACKDMGLCWGGFVLERPGSLFSLKSLKKLFRKQKTAKKERREKKGLEEGFGHADYFPGLAKRCMVQEN